MFESKTGVLLIGGLGFFLLAFVSNGLVPILMYQNLPEQTAQETVNANLLFSWEDLQRRFPEQFTEAFGTPPEDLQQRAAWDREKSSEALMLGRHIYIGEGCWHCHSQFVRPVSNESLRWGPVAETWEFQNRLQRPVMFGTRRVGPDLSREAGRRGNDWHAVHFFRPTLVSTGSPMPEYPWLFDGDYSKPNRRGLALITYVQWLGSWLESYPYYEDYRTISELEAPP